MKTASSKVLLLTLALTLPPGPAWAVFAVPEKNRSEENKKEQDYTATIQEGDVSSNQPSNGMDTVAPAIVVVAASYLNLEDLESWAASSKSLSKLIGDVPVWMVQTRVNDGHSLEVAKAMALKSIKKTKGLARHWTWRNIYYLNKAFHRSKPPISFEARSRSYFASLKKYCDKGLRKVRNLAISGAEVANLVPAAVVGAPIWIPFRYIDACLTAFESSDSTDSLWPIGALALAAPPVLAFTFVTAPLIPMSAAGTSIVLLPALKIDSYFGDSIADSSVPRLFHNLRHYLKDADQTNDEKTRIEEFRQMLSDTFQKRFYDDDGL